MKITRDNYEQYFLDHAEGALSPEMERELALFLELYPDLKPVLEDFDASPLPKMEIKNETLKNRLKKNIRPTLHLDEAHVEEWLIREVEGLLTKTESAELAEFIRLNPAYAYDQKLYSLTLTQPDLSVTFPRKSELKKKAPVVIFSRLAWTVYAAAAVILLIIGIRFFNQSEITTVPEENDAKVVEIQQGSQEETLKVARVADETRQENLTDSPEGTPSLFPATRTSSFRMIPSEATAINLNSPVESTEPVLYAYAPAPFELSEAKKESSIIGKVFGNMVHKTRNAIQGNSNLKKMRENDLNFWTIAEAGVKGFNTISDRDLELVVRRDGQGKIKSYALVEEDRLLITRNPGNN